MKKITFRLLIALLFSGCFNSHAQVIPGTKDTLKPGDTLHIQNRDTLQVQNGDTLLIHKGDTLKDYCVFCKGHSHIEIYAPYYNQFKRQLPFIVGASAIYAAGFILRAVDKPKPLTVDYVKTLDKNSVNSFDRVATGYWSPSAAKASDYLLFGISVLPAAFLSEHHTKKDIYPLAIMAAEAYLFNYGVTTICKSIAQRKRPYVYNDSLDIGIRTDAASQESFFSGHTSQTAAATFLFANVLSDYHPDMETGVKAGIWIFAAAVPAVEGYLRVKAGKHYPSDVIFGYAVGAASGWVIPRLHRYQKTHYKYGLGFLPYKDGMMMSMSYKL